MDWATGGASVTGRSVLLLDDVFVTGASILSYAAALRQAGAADVRGVVVVRHLRGLDSDYFDALRAVRHEREWTWLPSRAAVADGRSQPRVLG